MPSIGAAAIANGIGAKAFTVEGGFATQFISTADFVVKIANAIHAGWTSSSPSTPTSMVASFATEFSGFLTGNGLAAGGCIASAIDDETTDWANSWNGATHSYVVSAASIVSRVAACSPVSSNGMTALAEVVASLCMSGFGQETG